MPIAIAGNQITFNDNTVQTSANVATDKLLFDAGSLGFRNLMINGSMLIDNRNSGSFVSSVNTNRYVLDRYRLNNNLGFANSLWGIQQSLDAPPGFSRSAYVTVQNIASSIPSSGWLALSHFIEGNNIVRTRWGSPSARPYTLSFWVKSSLPGTYAVQLANARSAESLNYTYTATYVINAANTWEYKIISIPAPPGGAWRTDENIGIRLQWNLGYGTGAVGSANTWLFQGGQDLAQTGSGTINLWSTLNAQFFLTGVQLEEGTVATPFEYRPASLELSLCQRYYEVNSGPPIQGPGIGGATTAANWQFKVTKRATPTCTGGSPVAAGNTVGVNGAYVQNTAATAVWNIGATADAEL